MRPAYAQVPFSQPPMHMSQVPQVPQPIQQQQPSIPIVLPEHKNQNTDATVILPKVKNKQIISDDILSQIKRVYSLRKPDHVMLFLCVLWFIMNIIDKTIQKIG